MTASALFVDGRAIHLGPRIGKGGEGEVFALASDPSLAVKVYAVSDRQNREAKIVAMVRGDLAKHAPLVAFPLTVARTRDGGFAGFVMKLIGGHKPLHELYSPGPRKQHFPYADYRFVVRTAANISRAVASVHSTGCVIGDINHSGILVSSKAVVALIDADSFQITQGSNRFLCRVGVPEYTPPELQGKLLSTILRTPNHDAFGLAVVVFQLLFMGRHPFVGTVRRGDIPPLHEAIRDFRFAYTDQRDVGMDQPPGTPALTDFPPAVAAAFEAAFGKDSSSNRPTAQSWVQWLEELEQSLTQCGDNSLHFTPRDASDCPWCEMEQALGTYLFLPYVPHVGLVTAPFDPGAGGFNLDGIWARIESISLPKRERLGPKVSVTSPMPSDDASKARTASKGAIWGRITAGAIALIVLFAAPVAWVVWVPLAWWALFGGNSKKAVDSGRFRRSYIEAEQSWHRELEDYYRRCGIADLENLYTELREARDAYTNLGAEERSQIAAYQGQRHAKQLQTFLDGFDIRHARIKGIGPAKQAALASYGIDTAADVSAQKLLQVPGFGPSTSKPLLEWRSRLERRFVYQTAPNDADTQEIARIRSNVQGKAALLRKKLVVGPENLTNLLRRTQKVMAVDDPALKRAQANRDLARTDLEFLGIPVPTVATTTSTARTVSGPPTSSSAFSQTPRCPRCGSSMTRRMARRGRYAGHSFWGCSRYPSCKGTRN